MKVFSHNRRSSYDSKASEELPRWVSIGIFLLSTLLLLSTASAIFATLYFNQANLFLADWKESPIPPNAKALRIAHRAITRATSVHPFPPSNYFTTQGRIYEWQHYNLPPNHPSAKSSRANALSRYQIAAELNPRWGMHQLDIASVKIRQGNFDEELSATLAAALPLAPYRPEVLIRLIELGMMQWDKLPEPAQLIVASAVENAAASDIRTLKNVIHIAHELNQEAVICRLLSEKDSSVQKHFPQGCPR